MRPVFWGPWVLHSPLHPAIGNTENNHSQASSLKSHQFISREFLHHYINGAQYSLKLKIISHGLSLTLTGKNIGLLVTDFNDGRLKDFPVQSGKQNKKGQANEREE